MNGQGARNKSVIGITCLEAESITGSGISCGRSDCVSKLVNKIAGSNVNDHQKSVPIKLDALLRSSEFESQGKRQEGKERKERKERKEEERNPHPGHFTSFCSLSFQRLLRLPVIIPVRGKS